jgi:hypothetical protein
MVEGWWNRVDPSWSLVIGPAKLGIFKNRVSVTTKILLAAVARFVVKELRGHRIQM